MKELKDLVRTNVWNLKPYSSARDEFQGDASIFLDANENPWNAPYNRYPDPLQGTLKDRIAQLKGSDRKRIFLGNGSDEAIDLVIRIFCEPGEDNIITLSPTYGMYEVAAGVNNVECRKVQLNQRFDLDADKVLEAVDEHTKVLFLCSPNNPTGNSLDRDAIYRILKNHEGMVVLDEAYIDFSAYPSFLRESTGYPNLIILQTLSKAWGAAGIRLGMAFAAPEVVGLFNKIKYPYNISQLTQEKALELLGDTMRKEEQVNRILAERKRLEKRMSEPPLSFLVYPTDANFLLVSVGEADALYHALVRRGIVVRNRNNVQMCHGCLRITVGAPAENDALIEALQEEVKP